MHLTRDVRYAYAGYHHCPSHCRLRVYQTAQAVLALCTEVPDNPGTSITNRTEALAAAVWREEQRPACFVWVEHYPANPLRREAFRVVRFQQPQPGIFTHPTWYPLRAAILDILLAADPPAAALAPWHSLPAPPGQPGAERYRVLATLGYPHVLTLTDVEIIRTPEAAATRLRAFVAGRGRLPAPAPPEVAHDSPAPAGGAVHVPAA